jgi:hypothetical protein
MFRASRLLTLGTLLFAVTFMTVVGANAQATSKSTPAPSAISRGRLLAAYSHARNASELAKGGAALAEDRNTKAAAELGDAQLRRDIGLFADSAKANFSKVTTEAQQLDIAAHLHLARVKLTTNRPVTFKEARTNIVQQKRKGKRDSPAAAIQRSVEAIHGALKAG